MDLIQDEKYLSDVLKKIFTPILLSLGLIGNITSITIFRKKSMKNFTTFRYLTLLSFLDICSLYIGCAQIMLDVYFDIDFRLINEVSCRIQSFLVYFFTHFSSMLLACMSIDRTVAISFKSAKASTPKSAVNTFFVLGTILLVINFHFLIFTHLFDYNIILQTENDTSDYIKINRTNQTIGFKTVKICYAYIDTKYFDFLVNYFPW